MVTTAADPIIADALDRAITMDRLLPSFRNVVTEAAIEVYSTSDSSLTPGTLEDHSVRPTNQRSKPLSGVH